jgi:hypothetical protein
LLAAKHAAAMFAVEQASARSSMFDGIQPALAELMKSVALGRRTAELQRSATGTWVARLLDVSTAHRAALDAWFAATAQHGRGAWFLPKDVRLGVGTVNLPFYLREHPRFAVGSAQDDVARVPLDTTADAVVIWAFLEPWARSLYAPLWWRADAGETTRTDLEDAWTAFEVLMSDLGMEPPAPAHRARYGGGWASFRAEEQLTARQHFAAMIATAWTDSWATRFRCHQVRRLLERYYAKARGDGRARRKQVVTKGSEAVLVSYFGGDWLRWLEYLGESPHADERILGEAPVPRILAPAEPQITEVATAHGLPAEEVERMLAAVWGSSQTVSPAQERVAILRDYFAEFDALHARQASGMRPLWGLVDGREFNLRVMPSPHTSGLFEQLLSAPLRARVESAWRGLLLARYPDAIVSNPFPHVTMAETFGPALRFWEGVALTAWFFCEGPSSRTDLRGLERYHAKELALLEVGGTPVDRQLFADLIVAEARLGPPRPIERSVSSLPVSGFHMTISIGAGERREGFAVLRDLVTRHRRQWARTHLERYLRAQWETELRAVALDHHRAIGDRGKAPNPKQTAKFAAEAANRWTGGDLAALLGMIGEKSPPPARRTLLLREDGRRFAARVFAHLGGSPYSWEQLSTKYQGQELQRAYDQMETLRELAEFAPQYVQLQEALGRPLDAKEAGLRKIETAAQRLGKPATEIFGVWQTAISDALSDQKT